MAETQATQPTASTTQDVAETTRFRFADRLPGDLAEDRYVRYIAEQADRARDDLDAERALRREAETNYHEWLGKAGRAHLDVIDLKGQLADLKAQRTPSAAQTADMIYRVCLAVVILGFFAMVTLTTVLA